MVRTLEHECEGPLLLLGGLPKVHLPTRTYMARQDGPAKDTYRYPIPRCPAEQVRRRAVGLTVRVTSVVPSRYCAPESRRNMWSSVRGAAVASSGL